MISFEETAIGTRCHVFSFDGLAGFSPSNVTVILGETRVFFVDTYLGPRFMASIHQHLADKIGNKQVVVFNTHSDWDHVWGNSFFTNATICSHDLTRELLAKNGPRELHENEQYHDGTIELVYPTRTFPDRLRFEPEDIELFHSPGHTADSSSLVDLKNRVLCTGDNVEYPVPWLSNADVDSYLDTLQRYLDLDVLFVVPGHGLNVAGLELVLDNMHYIEALRDRAFDEVTRWKGNEIHEHNLSLLGIRDG